MFAQLDAFLAKLQESKGWKFWLKEKVFFYREMWFLLEWWVAIVEAVSIIKKTSKNPAIKDICHEIYVYLKKGENLSRALARMPKNFTNADIAIIRSGEKSWELTKVLSYLGKEYEFLYEVRWKYISVMVYPAILMLVSIGAVYIIFTQVLPGILDILASFDQIELPWTTQMLIAITEFLTTKSWMILVFLVLAWLFFSIIFSTKEWKRRLDYNIYNIPYFGTLSQYYQLIRFFRFMKLLLLSWMSYDEVFYSLKMIISSSAYRDMVRDITIGINKWEMVSKAMADYEDITMPADVIALIKVWEETASVTKSIDNITWLYKQEFEKMVDNASKVIEPVMVVVMGVIVWFIALSVFSIIGTILDSVGG